ncbi:MAG TPA: amidohydrolase family protein [Steroidobacteraceae bacterium]
MSTTDMKRRELIGAMLAGTAMSGMMVRAEEVEKAAQFPVKSAPMRNKITLEEHFVLPSSLGTTFHPPGLSAEAWKRIEGRLLDVTEQRLPQMDANGVAMQVVSLTANGIQGETDTRAAIDHAKAANDWLVERFVGPHPKRFAGFAAVPLQDPLAAAAETERAVTQLGFKGVLVNGYTNVGDEDHAEYLDLPKFYPFWERVESLGVPVYLHPRSPLPSQRLIYEGHDEMMGPMWAFGAETAAHALRLMTSGLFDRYPKQQLILGHSGEGLVAMMARAQRRFEYGPCGKVLKKPLGQYLKDHFYITTSGNFHTPTLNNVIDEMGIDRVMFSVDYPYESMPEGVGWFDGCPLQGEARLKVGRSNAERLLKLGAG